MMNSETTSDAATAARRSGLTKMFGLVVAKPIEEKIAPAAHAEANRSSAACQGKRTARKLVQNCAQAKNSTVAPAHENITERSRWANQNVPAAYSAKIAQTLCGSPGSPSP